jgi:TolB-like protein
MPDIFLSYNREDQAAARRFAEAFEADGFSVWWDVTLRSGEAYDQVTEEALRTAKAVVVLWSPRSVVSRWVRAEATLAERQKTLLPARIEPCDLPIMFELTQTADLAHWRGDKRDPGWGAFLADVRQMVGHEPIKMKKTPVTTEPDAGGGPPFVGLLPFTHRGGENLASLAEDLTDEITRELSQSSLFKVIAAGTMSAWQGGPKDYRAIRSELEALYVIEGKLHQAGEDVRLSLQVIETTSGGVLKSLRLGSRLDDVVAAPEEFTVTVATALGEDIEQLEMNRAMARSGRLSGWDHLLRAMAYARHSGSDTSSKAIEEARSAVAALPDLGLARAALAHALAVPAGALGIEPDDAVSREIQVHARRAMQLDGDNPAVFAQLMTSYSAIGDSETGLQLAERAMDLNPNSPNLLFWVATARAGLGRTAEAIATIIEYERLTRHDRYRYIASWIRGMCHFLDGQLDEAMAALDRSLALHPDFSAALKWKAIVVAHRGHEQVALAIVRRLREVEPAMTLDQHLWQMTRLPKLGVRCSEAAATLQRLWDAAECER